MAVRDFTFDPYEDTRSQQERQSDIKGALLSVAAIGAFVASRKKLAITRGVSREIMGAGLQNESRYEKYLSSASKAVRPKKIKSIREATLDLAEDAGTGFMDMIRDLFKPLPTDEESWNISIQYLNKVLKYPTTAFPAWRTLGLKESSLIEKIWKGPRVVPFAPGTTLGVVGQSDIPRKVGKHGAILIHEDLHFLLHPKKAERLGTFSKYKVSGVQAGIVNAWGANLERVRRDLISPINAKTTEEYIRKVELDPKSVMDVERREFIKRQYLARFFPTMGTVKGSTVDELTKLAEDAHRDASVEGLDWWKNPITQEQQRIPTLEQFMTHKVSSYEQGKRTSLTFRRKLLEEAAKTRRQIAKEAAKTKPAQLRFEAFKLARKVGVGEEFASYGAGFPQQTERWLREGAGWNYSHPASGDILPVTPRRYNVTGRTLGSNWKGNEGPWYITNPRDTFYRWLNMMSSGTLHKVWESASGLGITSRRNNITEFVRGFIGSAPGSWSDLFVRNIGKTGRAMALGFGAYYSYKFVDYLSKQTTGWGPSDIAAGSYVRYREFQQSVLDTLGVTKLSKTLENTFPGTMKSPLSHAARLLSPMIMARYLGRKYGPKGFATGLAAGTAFALITWGDITQSPEELHRIFTGEQDIPVRKGRYWLLGKTPFFGGKIAYWRPHWYPLMRSRYQYRGQLWDSETEYWAQGTPFSPILAPLLTGKLWDPYYWEKKHYKDRPYPITGELFEPTMPFAWLGNMTLGKLMKPSTIMHPEYLGSEQGTSAGRERGVPSYTAQAMGLPQIPGMGISRAQTPYSMRYQLGMAAYSQTEQMGLMGFFVNTLYEKLTGQQDFMSSQAVLQSSRRATGYERAYWEQELGDPGAGVDEGLTEYFRRFLPHRRTNVEEYNPVENEMPSWLPGDKYFINFKQGDPYVKVPMGEARLPGPGYESLHRMHSGTPGVYDAVDRFMVLANVAPYSDEYNQYKSLAMGMAKNDEYWSRKVQQTIAQRNALNQEYEFLSLTTENVPLLLKPASSIYRHSLAAITNFPNPLDMLPHKVTAGWVPAHINKWLPYKTPESAYRDYRLYGSEYAMWDEPMQGFVLPYMRKVRSMFDPGYIPPAVQRRREIQEYFDKLKYIKYSNLAQIARSQGDSSLASSLMRISKRTMAVGPYHAGAALTSIPKEEKSFFKDFSEAEGERRTRILNMVPSYMRNYYMTAWNTVDGEENYNVDYQKAKDLTGYFRNHYLPPTNWLGWHPDVSLDQVKLRVVKNEAFDIHKFNLWESNERQLSRQPFTPTVDNINAPTNDMTMLQNTIVSNMERFGMTNNRVYISRTPSHENSHRVRVNVSRDNRDEHDKAMRSTLAMR